MVTRPKISREEAERLITEYQLSLLRRYDCLSTWELYALYGVGHCCGGVYSRSSVELRELYRDYIEGIDALSDAELLKVIVNFELLQLEGQSHITWQPIGLVGRRISGLNCHASQELAITDLSPAQLEGQSLITCRDIGRAGRICDGLNRYTNQEIVWLFPEVLAGYTVVD